MGRSAQYLALTISACLLAGVLAKGIQHGLPQKTIGSEEKNVSKVRIKRGFFSFVAAIIVVGCILLCRSGGSSGGSAPRDNDDPYFTHCPSDIHITIPKGQTSVDVTWENPKAEDATSKIASIKQPSGGVANGSPFSKTSTITYLALDEFSNSAECQFTVHVTLITCTRPTRPQNGDVQCPSGDIVWGKSCTWSCNAGYELLDPSTATQECNQNTKFSTGGSVTCRKKLCVDVNVNPNMVLEFCTDESRYQSVCNIKCMDGYGPLDKTRTLTCNTKQEWEGNLYPCTELPDKEPPYFTFCPSDIHVTIPEGKTSVTVTWDEPEAVDSDSGLDRIVQTPGLSQGSMFENDAKITYQAIDKQTNFAECSFNIFVTLITCANPTVPNHGDVACPERASGLLIWGDMCTWSCDDGYEVSGTMQQICTQNGEFSNGGMTICSRKECPSIESRIQNHMILNSCTDQNKFESVCDFTCNEGYGPLTHSRKLTCTAEQVWLGDIEQCRDIEPPLIENCPQSITVYTERGMNYGIATWTEPVATDRQGTAHIQLTVGLPPGSQFATEPTNLHQIVYSAIDDDINEAEQCQFNVQVIDRTCEPFPDTEKMTKACDGSSWGSSCQLTCDNGYPLNGSGIVYCEETEDGITLEWDVGEYYPFCKILPCPDLNPPANGALACSNWAHGRYCQMSCNIDYDTPRSVLSGEWTCDETAGMWNPDKQPPACTQRINPNAMYTRNTLFYFTGDCTEEATQTQIRENFIEQINLSRYRTICTASDECSVDNVDVTCGPVTRKKRDIRNTRSIFTHKVEINFLFKINIRYPENFTLDDADNVLNTMDTLFFEMSDLFQQDVSSGAMDLNIPGLETEVDPDSYISNWGELECDYGMTPKYATFSCAMCPQGTMYNGDLNDCEDCPVGTYQDEAGQVECKACPENTFTLTTAAIREDQCKAKCSAGHYSTTGLEPCALCHVGSYQHERGTSSCNACPSETTTLSTGSIEITLCLNNDEIDDYFLCNKTACNGGICLFNSDGTTHCVCHDGYTGEACEIPPDPCEDIVCDNGGSCVSVNSEYMCNCQLGYTGQNCQELAQNGGYTEWTLWSECSLACGTATRSRLRVCNSPAPGQNGLPCQGDGQEIEACQLKKCPVCEPLEIPDSYIQECSIVGEDEHECDIRCKDGYASIRTRFRRISCGPKTNYEWSFRVGNANRNLPSCAQSSLPTTVSVTSTLMNSGIACDAQMPLNSVESFVTENSNCSSIPNCQTNVYSECSKTEAKRNVRDLSSKTILIEIKGTLPNLNYFPNGVFDRDVAIIAEESWITLATSINNLIQAIAEAAASGELLIIADGVEYEVTHEYISDVHCPDGTVPQQGLCVICPVGMYQTDQECELCTMGTYQDRQGQASCKLCPDGLTTLEEGAVSSSECNSSEDNPDTTPTSTTSSKTNNPGDNSNEHLPQEHDGVDKETSPDKDDNDSGDDNLTGNYDNKFENMTTLAPGAEKAHKQTPDYLYPAIGSVVAVVLILLVIVAVVIVLKKKQKDKPKDCDNLTKYGTSIKSNDYEPISNKANGCYPASTSLAEGGPKCRLSYVNPALSTLADGQSDSNCESNDNHGKRTCTNKENDDFDAGANKVITVEESGNGPLTASTVNDRPATASSIPISMASRQGSVVSLGGAAEDCNTCPQIQ